MTHSTFPRIVLTAGEPAGIGPDIVLEALLASYSAAVTVIGDGRVLNERASQLGLEVDIVSIRREGLSTPHRAGRISVIEIPVDKPVKPGQLDLANTDAVIRGIDLATDLCLNHQADAMVTAPVHKAILNEAGIPFRGHTEWIAQRAGGTMPVMMLASPSLRVGLATTHLPLAEVPRAITREHLTQTLEIMSRDLGRLYGLDSPRIGVLGLNPHAGEGGYLGMEEVETILPVVQALQSQGMPLVGPLPADTAFNPATMSRLDAILAMYHDQGLPVIKYQGFGHVVNVTLGLPLVRTSVDHGTALDLAGTGRACADSLMAAIHLAVDFTQTRSNHES